jgi:hypothetical protein
MNLNKSQERLLSYLKYSYNAVCKSTHYSVNYSVIFTVHALNKNEEKAAENWVKDGLFIKLYNDHYTLTKRGMEHFKEYLRS